MTDALHYMTKFHYGLLAIMFAALLLLAPAIFSFFSIQQQATTSIGQTSTVSVGSMRLFLATSAVMICGVIGQLITVGLAIAEVRFRGYITFASMAVIIGLLVIAGVGAIVSAIRTAGSYPSYHPQCIRFCCEYRQSRCLAVAHKLLRAHLRVRLEIFH
ncbi:MAG: hypothetical protein WB660_17785 [Candidatus Sulfotelmatobacter sp.]